MLFQFPHGTEGVSIQNPKKTYAIRINLECSCAATKLIFPLECRNSIQRKKLQLALKIVQINEELIKINKYQKEGDRQHFY